MEKSLLVVLMSLQVFLLFTIFTSTDAATLTGDLQMPPRLVKRSTVERERLVKRNNNPYPSGKRPGVHGAMGRLGPPGPPPCTRPRPEATLTGDPQMPPRLVKRSTVERERLVKKNNKPYPSGNRPGERGAIGQPGPPGPPPCTRPRPEGEVY